VNRGYQVKLFVPGNFSQEKVIIMRALGADVVSTPDAEGMQGAIQRAKELVASDPTAFMAGQFENLANPDYHYETTAREIFEQMKERSTSSCSAAAPRELSQELPAT
jgi:cysteine synthase